MPRSTTLYVCAFLLTLAFCLFLLADGQSLLEAKWAVWHRGWHATVPHDVGAIRFKLPERWISEPVLSPPQAAGQPAIVHAVLGGHTFGDGAMAAMLDIRVGPVNGPLPPPKPAVAQVPFPEVTVADESRNLVVHAITSDLEVYTKEQLAAIAREVLASVERHEATLARIFTEAKPAIAAREQLNAEAQRVLSEWAGRPIPPANQWIVTESGDLLRMLGADLCQVMATVATLEHRLLDAALEKKLQAAQASLLYHEDGHWKLWHRRQINETKEDAIQAWGANRTSLATIVRFHLVDLNKTNLSELRAWLAHARDPI